MMGNYRFVNAILFAFVIGSAVLVLTTNANAYCPPDIGPGVTVSISASDTLTNSGDCTVLPGGQLINFGNVENTGELGDYGVVINQNGATLTNSAIISNIYRTELLNGATLFNNGSGTSLINQHGAMLTNSGIGTNLFNQHGAMLTNSGGILYPSGYYMPSSISNSAGATLTNYGLGTNLYNLDGTYLSNYGAGTNLDNKNGATLTNSGWSSYDRYTISQIINGGGAALTNSGKGANLYNINGAVLVNNNYYSVPSIYDPISSIYNLNGATFTNSGEYTKLYNTNGAALKNDGSDSTLINQNGATLKNEGSTFINQNGATLINSGNSSYSVTPTSLENLYGATLTNDGSGTSLINQNGATLVNGGIGANLFNQNGAKLINLKGSVISNQGSATLTNSALFTNDGSIKNNGGTFIVTSTGTVNGSGVFSQEGGGTLTVDGVMAQSTVNLETGRLNGAGIINGSVNVDRVIVAPGLRFDLNPGNSYDFDPNRAFETLTINGKFGLTNSFLFFDVSGLETGKYDLLVINGEANFHAGTIMFNFLNKYLPTKGEYFDFLISDTILGFDNMKFDYRGLAPDFHFEIDVIMGNTLRFTALTDGVALPAPEPATMLLFGTGIVGLAAVGRRKRS